MSQTQPPAGDDLGTVVDIVDTLEELLGSARRLPFTPSVVVNEEEILELVDRIRVALPDDLLTARHTVDERDQMLERAEHEAAELNAQAQRAAAQLSARAQEEAERMVREAQAHAAAMIEEHEIVRRATQSADALVTEAEAAAAAQRAAADDYAHEVMRRLEDQLERWLARVRDGLQSLPEPVEPRRRRKR
jgi:DNA anti-recombination protein RmuC